MKGTIAVTALPETAYGAWNRLVAQSPQGSIYSTPEYLDVLCGATGGRFKILGVLRNDTLLGGVGLYLTDTMQGPTVSNRLLLYYNGPVVADSNSTFPSVRTARQIDVLTALEQSLSAARYARIRFHNRHTLADVRPFLARGWSARPAYTYVVPITDLAAQWGRVEQNLRRLINRCSRHEIVVTDDDDFDGFYRLHRETASRKGAPLYLPHEAFKRYFERLRAQDLCRLYHVRDRKGRSIATELVLLGSHPVTHTVCAGADAEFLSLGATPYLRWKVFEALARLGYAANDLTDAGLNSVTHFKSQLGGDLQTTLVVTRTASRSARLAARLEGLVRRGRSVAAGWLRGLGPNGGLPPNDPAGKA